MKRLKKGGQCGIRRKWKGVHRVEIDACLIKLVIRKEEKTEGRPQGRHLRMLVKVLIRTAKKTEGRMQGRNSGCRIKLAV